MRKPILFAVCVCSLVLAVPAAASADGPFDAISTSSLHSCAIVDEAAYCWGPGQDGRLGNGSSGSLGSLTAAPVVGLDAQVQSIETLNAGGCAVVAGAAKCWGQNAEGQVGNGVAGGSFSTPQTVVGLSSGVTDLAAGGSGVCAVHLGLVKCWGRVTSAGINSATPTTVPGIVGDATRVDVTESTICAIVDGAAKCLGTGLGTTIPGGAQNSTTALQVDGLTSGVSDIAIDGSVKCVVHEGAVKCWGDGSDTAQAVTGLESEVTDLTSGGGTVCVVQGTDLKCWRGGAATVTGTPGGSTPTTPTVVSGVSSAESVSVQGTSACAVLSGYGKCWGTAVLGVGLDRASALTPRLDMLDGAISEVDVAKRHGCAIEGSTVKCWGTGSIGTGGSEFDVSPQTVGSLGGTPQSLDLSSRTTCAIVSGAVKCWGGAFYFDGGVGNGAGNSAPAPVAVSGMSAGVTDISVSSDHACAVVSGAAKCWGSNHLTKLGDGTDVNRPTPVQVVGLESGVTEIATDDRTSCAVVSGSVECWGVVDRDFNHVPILSSTPVDVPGSSGASSLSVGGGRVCFVVSGAAKCRGDNSDGALGTAVADSYSSDVVTVTGLESGVTEVATYVNNTCAIRSADVWCLGGNEFGQLGDGGFEARSVPQLVPGVPSGATSLGGETSCAVAGGNAYCWGGEELSWGALRGFHKAAIRPFKIQLPVDTDWTSVPDSPTASPDAQFEFTSSASNPTFRCSLDGGPWAAATSPLSITVAGSTLHDLRCQASDEAGFADAIPASTQWNVDTIGPSVEFDSASLPAGLVFQPTDLISFRTRSIAGLASSTCSIDGGQSFNGAGFCAFDGLAGGAHSLTVSVVDVFGRTAGATLAFTVVSPPGSGAPPQPSVPAVPFGSTVARSARLSKLKSKGISTVLTGPVGASARLTLFDASKKKRKQLGRSVATTLSSPSQTTVNLRPTKSQLRSLTTQLRKRKSISLVVVVTANTPDGVPFRRVHSIKLVK